MNSLFPWMLCLLPATPLPHVPLARVATQESGFAPSASEWDARDVEGRWVLIERETLAHGWRRIDSMVAFLEARRETDLLERLCLYPRAEGHFATFEAALARLDAPQWARAVEWNLRQLDSHKRDEAHAAFFERRPGLALAWLEAHETTLRPMASAALARLRGQKPEPQPAAHLLPPWDLSVALAPLAAPSPVLDFADRLRAEPGQLYLHQVEAALRAVAQKQLFEEPWRGAVIALSRHARPEVRSFAWITLGEAARGTLPVDALDDSAFVAAIDSSTEDARVRIAATVALARRVDWSPRAWCELHRLAGSPAHPAWAAAVHSLRDCGDEMTVELLEELVPTLKDDTQLRLALGTLETLRARGPIAIGALALTLERCAYAELARIPLAERRTRWALVHLAKASRTEAVDTSLRELAAGYSAAADVRASVLRVVPDADLDGAVRSFVRRALDLR